MSPKEYLQQAYKIDQKIKLNKDKLKKMRSQLYGKSINYESDGSQHTPSGNSTEATIVRVMEYEEQINAENDKLISKRLEIEQVINAVPDDVQREILTRRFLLYQEFESHYDKNAEKHIVGIDEEIGYSARQMYRLYNDGLKAVRKILKDVIECQ